MAITIKDVAKRAGVGIGTVSRVLNGGNSVSDATKEKVEAAIIALEYTPNQQARRLVTGKSLTIGIIAPFFTSQSVVERLRGIETVIAASDYDMIIFNIDSRERLDKYTSQLSTDDKVDGLIVISMGTENKEIVRLVDANIPTIILDAESATMSNVTIDDVAGGYKATKHLIKLGHAIIGFVSDRLEAELGNHSSDDRFEGYKRALADSNIPFRPELVQTIGYTRQDGYQMGNAILRQENRPTAIVAGSDILAVGILHSAREIGLEIPYNLSVIGYDDIEMAEFMDLTTIRQPLYESGRKAAEMLLRLLNNPSSEKEEYLLSTSVVIRGTTAVVPR
ncbi:MAG: LacI family transcriptional regulator [Candidatus Promineifilaceae bacterium]|jgi:LacI family transcriptional regulator